MPFWVRVPLRHRPMLRCTGCGMTIYDRPIPQDHNCRPQGLISHNGHLPDHIRQKLGQPTSTEANLRKKLAEKDQEIDKLRKRIIEHLKGEL